MTGWNIQFPFLASRKVFHFPLSPFFAEWQWFRSLGRVLRLLNDNRGSWGFKWSLRVETMLMYQPTFSSKHGSNTRASLEALNFLSWQWVALKPARENAFHVPSVKTFYPSYRLEWEVLGAHSKGQKLGRKGGWGKWAKNSRVSFHFPPEIHSPRLWLFCSINLWLIGHCHLLNLYHHKIERW